MSMHFFQRLVINDMLRLAERQSYRLVPRTKSGRIRSDALLELLNRSRVGIAAPLSYLPNDLLKPEEVELKYGVTKRELRRWTRRKRNPSPHYRLNKFTLRYPEGLLGEWLKENS